MELRQGCVTLLPDDEMSFFVVVESCTVAESPAHICFDRAGEMDGREGFFCVGSGLLVYFLT